MTIYIPPDIRNIILLYINELELYDKLDFACRVFLAQFAKVYGPIAAGQMDKEPSIYNNFANYHIWPDLEKRFKRANVLFNYYCHTIQRAAIQPKYWISRTMNTIDWHGVAIMARGYDFEFIKLQGCEDQHGALTKNGYALFNVSELSQRFRDFFNTRFLPLRVTPPFEIPTP